jgi:hypothetical protein
VLERNCPLCGENAPYQAVNYGLKHLFDCPQCKAFVISPNSETENLVKHAPQEHRLEISSAAQKLPDDRVLVISSTVSNISEGGTSNKEIKITWEEKPRGMWN